MFNPEACINENGKYKRHKAGTKPQYRLTGTFDSLMMRYGEQEWSGFEMMDLHTFLGVYGKQIHSNMMYFVRDMFNYVPADSPEKAIKTIADVNT